MYQAVCWPLRLQQLKNKCIPFPMELTLYYSRRQGYRDLDSLG